MGEIGHSWNTLVKPQDVLPILGGLALITQGVIVQALFSLYPIPLYLANGHFANSLSTHPSLFFFP